MVIPWDKLELLKVADILRRIKYQNTSIPIDRWRIIKTRLSSADDQLVVCCIDNDTLQILEKNQFRLNYASG